MNSSLRNIVIIGGCGHVGLPLGVAWASEPNHRVTLLDTNEESLRKVREGKFPFVEEGGDKALAKVIGKTLFAESRPEVILAADYIVIVTGTPVDEHLNPNVGDILKVIDSYLPYMRPGQLIILRSTIFPGITELVWKHLKTTSKGIGVAFCPERIAQGHALSEIRELPQIVAACEKEMEDRAADLFSTVIPHIVRLSPKEAELAKLFSNSWRYLQFAIANQFYMIAENSGADFYRIHDALNFRYPRANYVRAGFTAGPCLFKDTLQLSAFHDNNFFLGHAAMLVNEGLPQFVVQQLEKKLGTLEDKRVGILGMAFKPNNDDTRDALSYKVKKILETKMAKVLCTDVYQPKLPTLDSVLTEADGLILGVPHQAYLEVNPGKKPFIDCWGVWRQAVKAGLPTPASKPKKAA